MMGGCGQTVGGRGLRGGRGVADRGGTEATDGVQRKRKDAHLCKKDVIASVTEIQREERKTGVCLNAAWETIPSRCTPALSGGENGREEEVRRS